MVAAVDSEAQPKLLVHRYPEPWNATIVRPTSEHFAAPTKPCSGNMMIVLRTVRNFKRVVFDPSVR